jgi:hypothetical protein
VKRRGQNTTFTTQSTTTTPSKHHVLHHDFHKNPCKNVDSPAQRKYMEEERFCPSPRQQKGRDRPGLSADRLSLIMR